MLPIILLLADIPFKLITMAIVFSLLFLKDTDKVIKIIGISVYLIFSTIGIFGLFNGGFVENTVIDMQYSPNKMYRIVTIDSEQETLGGDTYVYVEKIYYGIVKRDIKTLYEGDWDEKPQVNWIDNDNVKIYDRKINIYASITCKP